VRTLGGLDNASAMSRVARQQFASEFNVQTMPCILNSASLMAHVKKIKPLLLPKNIKAQLEFATSHRNWIGRE